MASKWNYCFVLSHVFNSNVLVLSCTSFHTGPRHPKVHAFSLEFGLAQCCLLSHVPLAPWKFLKKITLPMGRVHTNLWYHVLFAYFGKVFLIKNYSFKLSEFAVRSPKYHPKYVKKQFKLLEASYRLVPVFTTLFKVRANLFWWVFIYL